MRNNFIRMLTRRCAEGRFSLAAYDTTLLPLAWVARYVGVPFSTVHMHVRVGKLHATQVKHRLMVLPAEVERYRNEVVSRRTDKDRGGRVKETVQ